MKRFLTLLLSCFVFAAAAPAETAKPAVMTVAVPGMDAAIAEKAVAAVTPVSGVIAVAPDLKKSQLKITIQRENAPDTRKAVRKALKEAGIKFEAGEVEKDKKEDKPQKPDKASKEKGFKKPGK